MIGTTLDKYEVLQKVGEGGMATVYRGRHSTLRRDVAIKVLHPHLSSSTRNRMRFAREAKAVERLRHDNILEIFDYSGDEANDCYIVTEFVDGETLTSLLSRCGRLPSEVVALIGVHVTRALAFAHAEGILHRDLKPDNIMIRVDGTLKLMDFGIARFLDESQVTMTGALVGSPAFMSPEQARESDLDLRSDLFSLGTVLFYLVTGHLPFSGSNPSLILKNVIEGNRPNVSELSPSMSASLADVVERLMATSADDRYVSAEDVERQLLRCLSEVGIDIDDPAWHLKRFVDEPEAYEGRLENHLRVVLLTEGRRLLQQGDHLAALRLLNRLLSLDEDNEEVLELVQNLHGDVALSGRRGVWLTATALLGFVAVLVALWAAGGMGAKATALPSVPPAVPEPTAGAAVVQSSPPGQAAASIPDEAPAPQPSQPEPAGDDSEHAAAAPTPEPVRARRERPTEVKSTHRIERTRPSQPEPAPLSAPEEPKFGTVVVQPAGGLHAYVYVMGNRMGPTHQAISLPVGSHDLEIRSPYTEPYVAEGVEVSNGEKRTVSVSLKVRPAHVVFPDGWDAECRVSVKEGRAPPTNAGTLGALGFRLEAASPHEPVSVDVTCPDGELRTKKWRMLETAEVAFPPPAAGTDRP
ncbi:MAG: protein kinase [Myxococcales bacterium]|nr:protein kinase [Myxococcales bacterium]